jgi:hypothetical protein
MVIADIIHFAPLKRIILIFLIATRLKRMQSVRYIQPCVAHCGGATNSKLRPFQLLRIQVRSARSIWVSQYKVTAILFYFLCAHEFRRNKYFFNLAPFKEFMHQWSPSTSRTRAVGGCSSVGSPVQTCLGLGSYVPIRNDYSGLLSNVISYRYVYTNKSNILKCREIALRIASS